VAHPVLDQQQEAIEVDVGKTRLKVCRCMPFLYSAQETVFWLNIARLHVPIGGKSNTPSQVVQISLSQFLALSHSPKEVTPPLQVVVFVVGGSGLDCLPSHSAKVLGSLGGVLASSFSPGSLAIHISAL
jgi:hypothetical protein